MHAFFAIVILVSHTCRILAAEESSDALPVATLASLLLVGNAPIRQHRWPAPILLRAATARLSETGEQGADDRIRELERENAKLREARIRELEQQNEEMRQREEAAARKKAAEEQAAAERTAAMEQAAAERARAEREAAERTAVEEEKLKKLLLSIFIDIIGVATYAVPVVGEAGDLAWAPISAFLVYQLYGNGIISGLAFAEELLPGLDIIPTATIAWVLENTEFGQNLVGKAPADEPSEMKRARGSIIPDDQKGDRR